MHYTAIRNKITILAGLGTAGWLLAGLAGGCAGPGTARMRTREYRVRVEGAPTTPMARDLLAMSNTAQTPLDETPDPGRLAVLARRDVPALRRVLDAHGHFAARVDVDVLSRPRRRPVATFRIDPGPVYTIERLVSKTAASHPHMPGLSEGGFAAPVSLVRETRRAQDAWRNLGHPFARVEIDRVVVDHSTRTADVFWTERLGPEAVFGPVSFEGRNRLRQGWLRDAIPWRQGDPWQASLLELYRAELLASGLFSSVETQYPEEPGEEALLPVTVRLRERRPRTISAAAGYRTDEGFGGAIAWSHRNVTGGAERLNLRLEWAETVQAYSLDFRRPRFLRRDQALRIEAEASAIQTDAFETDGYRVALVLEREWTRGLTAEAGVAGRLVRIDQAGQRDRFSLLSLPAGLEWDGRDSTHDPKRGGRAFLRSTPFHDLGETGIWFFKNEIEGIRYARIFSFPDLRLAARMRLGALTGSGPLRIPADERFYAGGGGSVRGYAYQSLAPRDPEGFQGGRSLVETSLELRWRATEHFGLVAFADGASVMRSAWPDGSERMFWGTGAGLRYHTAVGPVRLDVGIPLNRRAGIDDPWQLYVSIGQAF